MRLLLDTHALIWSLAAHPSLSGTAREAIAESANDILVGAVSAMEISTKYRLGKLPGAALLAQDFEAIVDGQGFAELPITIRHGQIAGNLQAAHQDPFDRLLIAQAIVEGLVLISNETLFDGLGVKRIW